MVLVGEVEDFHSYLGPDYLYSVPDKVLTCNRFLSVAWTMTDYDGTTQ
jgi:hypothetical protein